MQSSDVMVISDPQTIEYIFDTDNAVSMTEFKAAQGLADIGLLIPVKALHNGCDKLIYKITGLNSLSDVVRSNGGNISDMTGKLGRIIDEVKEFGFLQVQHLDWDMDRIFVEPDHRKIFMIYIPAEVTQPEPWENRYWHIIDEIKAKAPSMLAEETVPAFTVQENAQPQKTEENKKGIFKKLFKDKKPEQGTKNAASTKGGKKGKKAAAARKQVDRIEAEYSGGTELLDSVFIPSLVIMGVNTSQKVEDIIGKEEYVIGKNPQHSDLVISYSKAVSNKHCSIVSINGASYVIDHQSTNGTYLNGIRLQSGERVQIKAGDKLRLANCDFVIRSV